MIIPCQNCNKKFDIDRNLIPKKGRLLQCNSCNHKWFFKEEIEIRIDIPSTNENLEIFEFSETKVNNPIDTDNNAINKAKTNNYTEETGKKIEISKIKKKKKILNLTIVFITSFIALIILIDTFKSPLNKIFPNLEILLYNLYETIKDIRLFINDLI